MVNALIGGVVFCDSLGVNCKLSSPAVRWATTIALLLGWGISSLLPLLGLDLVSFILAAQSLTVLCFPLLALVILWQLYKVPSNLVPLGLKPVCWAGLLAVVALSLRTAWGLLSS